MNSIPDFQYKAAGGSFKSWLLQLTAWRIGDQYRNRQPNIQPAKRLADSTARTATVDGVPDPAGSGLEAIWDKEWEQNLMNAATDRVKRTVDPKQYQIFDLYVACVVRHWNQVEGMQDIKISRLAGRLKYPLLYHCPSLIQHVGRSSVWGGAFHQAPDFDAYWKA